MTSVYDHSSDYFKSLRRVVKFVELVHQQYEGTQSHNFPQYFLQNGAIYLVSTKRAAYSQTFLYPNCVPFQMDYSSSIDIDTSDIDNSLTGSGIGIVKKLSTIETHIDSNTISLLKPMCNQKSVLQSPRQYIKKELSTFF